MSGYTILPSVPQMLRNAFNGTDYDGERLERARTLFASIPEGKALLDLAASLDIDIRLEHRKGTLGIVSEKIKYMPDAEGNLKEAERRKVLCLSPRLSDRDMIEIMAHELRHVWQAHTLAHEKKPIFPDPADAIAYIRLIEGDAHAFQKFFMEKLDGGNPAPESMRENFFKFQKTFWRSMGYDTRTILKSDDERAAAKSDDKIRQLFNERSTRLSEIGNFSKMLVAGLDAAAPAYLDASDAGSLKTMMLENVGLIARKALASRGYSIAAAV